MNEDPQRRDELEHLYALVFGRRDGLAFCGCGNPEDAYALVRDLLALAPFHQHPGKVRERIGGDNGAQEMVLHVLDRAGLIEHGTGIGGSWLTGKGKHYLPLMQRYEYDDFAGDGDQAVSVGFPHDGKDCPPDCPHAVVIAAMG